MTNIGPLRQALIERMLDGEGTASRDQRRTAFDNSGANAGLAASLHELVRKTAVQATMVTDSDIAAARAAGFSEEQIFEIVVCAAVGQSMRQYQAASAALDATLGLATRPPPGKV